MPTYAGGDLWVNLNLNVWQSSVAFTHCGLSPNRANVASRQSPVRDQPDMEYHTFPFKIYNRYHMSQLFLHCHIETLLCIFKITLCCELLLTERSEFLFISTISHFIRLYRCISVVSIIKILKREETKEIYGHTVGIYQRWPWG